MKLLLDTGLFSFPASGLDLFRLCGSGLVPRATTCDVLVPGKSVLLIELTDLSSLTCSHMYFMVGVLGKHEEIEK